MLLKEAVYAIGQANAGLAALLGAGSAMRLYPVAEEVEHAVPRVIFEEDMPEPIAGIFQDSGWYKTRVRFRAYGATPIDAENVIAAVRAAWQRWNSYTNGPVTVGAGTMWIEDAKATGWGAEDRDYDLAQYWKEIELEFFYK